MLNLLIVGGDLNSRQEKAFLKIKNLFQKKGWQPQNNPDFFLLDSPISIGIQDIRQLQNWLSLKPFNQKLKVAFLKRAENLTVESQNALLKTLEETPQDSIIILCAPDSTWLLPTIVSRCQIIQLPPTAQISLSNEEFKEFQEIFQKFGSPKIGERWQALEKAGIYQDRIKAIEWVDKMIFLTRKLMIEQYLENKSLNYSISQLLNYLKSLNRTKTYLQANTNIRLTLENFLLDLPSSNC